MDSALVGEERRLAKEAKKAKKKAQKKEMKQKEKVKNVQEQHREKRKEKERQRYNKPVLLFKAGMQLFRVSAEFRVKNKGFFFKALYMPDNNNVQLQ